MDSFGSRPRRLSLAEDISFHRGPGAAEADCSHTQITCSANLVDFAVNSRQCVSCVSFRVGAVKCMKRNRSWVWLQ
jgi:hypothetical protein